VANRNNAAVGTLPTYNALGGPNGKGHVSFLRSSLQFIDGGTQTLNIATNGGLTFVAVLRPTSSIKGNDIIYYSAANTVHDNQIRIEVTNENGVRWTLGGIQVGMAQSSTPNNILILNTWITVVFRFNSATKQNDI
jgi:hypothetical protein